MGALIEIDPRYLTNIENKATPPAYSSYDLVSLLHVSVDEFYLGSRALSGICIDKGYKSPLNQCFKAHLFLYSILKCLVDNKSNLLSKKSDMLPTTGDTCFIYLVTSGLWRDNYVAFCK